MKEKTPKILKISYEVQLVNLLNTNYYSLINTIISQDYYSFSIPKKSGGKRIIIAPNKPLSTLQKILNNLLQEVYISMDLDCVFGFNTSQRSNIYGNAKKHINKQYVLNVDIKDFFPNINSKMVRDMFMSKPFNFNEKLASILAMLSTYNNSLPMGAPSSPIISNFVFYNTDINLLDFAQKNGLTYSRYADDITFSSNDKINKNIVDEISLIIEPDGFVLNNKKTRLQKSNSRQTVTGLTVNEKVNINRKYIRNIRAILHDIRINGIDAAISRYEKISNKLMSFGDNSGAKIYDYSTFNAVLRGKIEFVGFVKGKEDDVYKKLLLDYFELVGNVDM